MEDLRIMGLDLSVNGTGVCLADGSTFRIPGKAKEGDARLTRIRDHVRLAVRTNHTRLAVIEGMGGHYPGNAQTSLAQVHGVVKVELMDLGVPYAVIPQSSLKLFATGRGGADKAAMARGAAKHADLTFESDDECDAWWLWQAGMVHYGMSALDRLPAVQRAALDVVEWWVAPAPALVPAGRETAAQDVLSPGCPACEGWGHIHKGCVLR
jgi:Holliday junction resolvasome RuvABC endonuclease subunit